MSRLRTTITGRCTEDEIAHRRRAGYPPFARLARLLHRDTNRERGLEEAGRIAAELRMLRDAAGRAEPDVLGPMAAFIPRIRGEYRFQVLLRGRHPARLLENVRLGDRWSVRTQSGEPAVGRGPGRRRG